jgi:hypothetical protein
MPIRDQLPRRARTNAHPERTADTLRIGDGRPLEPHVRDDFSRRLGFAFDDVRVHDDAAAHESARALGANAFATGTHIVFAHGRYAPETTAGRRLLAHELAHVVQQRHVASTTAPTGDALDGNAEPQAQAVAARVAAGAHAAVSSWVTQARPGIQRDPTGKEGERWDPEQIVAYASAEDADVALLLKDFQLTRKGGGPTVVWRDPGSPGRPAKEWSLEIVFLTGSTQSYILESAASQRSAWKIFLGTKPRHNRDRDLRALNEVQYESYQAGARLFHELLHMLIAIGKGIDRAHAATARIPEHFRRFESFLETAKTTGAIASTRRDLAVTLDVLLRLPKTGKGKILNADDAFEWLVHEVYDELVIQSRFIEEKDAKGFGDTYADALIKEQIGVDMAKSSERVLPSQGLLRQQVANLLKFLRSSLPANTPSKPSPP